MVWCRVHPLTYHMNKKDRLLHTFTVEILRTKFVGINAVCPGATFLEREKHICYSNSSSEVWKHGVFFNHRTIFLLLTCQPYESCTYPHLFYIKPNLMPCVMPRLRTWDD